MPRLVSVSAADLTLWHLSLRYLGDANQAGRIAAVNSLSDFWLFGLTQPTELIIPDPDPTQADYAPSQPGSDFLALWSLSQPGTSPGGPTVPSNPTAETLTITSVLFVATGQFFTVSGLYTNGPPMALDYNIDDGAWLSAAGIFIANGGFVFSVPGMSYGNHTIAVRDSNAITIATPDFDFVVTTASGSTGIPPGVAYDPDNDFGGDVEDIVVIVSVPAPLGQFVLGINCFAPDPVSQAPPGSDITPDWEALGLPSGD